MRPGGDQRAGVASGADLGGAARPRGRSAGWRDFARLIMFDRRGTGLSDPVIEPPTLEQQVDDLRAVLAAVGRRAGVDDRRLATSASRRCSPRPIPSRSPRWCSPAWPPTARHTLTGAAREQMLDAIENSWGDGTLVSLYAPSQVGNREFVRVVGADAALGGQPRDGAQADGDDRADQPARRPADDPRADARRCTSPAIGSCRSSAGARSRR